jgi:hypothetical protein
VLEDTGPKRRSSKAENEQQARAFTASVEQYARGGGSGSVATLSDPGAQHLAVLYLYCLQKVGPCPFILDTVLEGDVAAARGTSGTDCQSMSRFWKKWLDNALEQRVKYLLPLGSMTAVASFNAVERPKYVKCKDTVAKLKGSKSDRYGAEGSTTQAASKTAKLLLDVTDRNIDIYAAVGLKNTPATKDADKVKK